MSTTGADDSEATKVVMAYLNENKLSDKLNDAVNVVAKHRPQDCIGMLIRELAKFAKPSVITRVGISLHTAAGQHRLVQDLLGDS